MQNKKSNYCPNLRIVIAFLTWCVIIFTAKREISDGRIVQHGGDSVTVYEALSLMITFGILIATIFSNKR